jgi:uncharacterized membrane protein YdbT with pleckstrin-like domain
MRNKTNMKAGSLRVEIQEEEILWFDKKRVTIFALPWSFTKYKLTPTKLIVEKGLFVTHEEEVKLYRVTDISYSQNLLGKMNNTGSLMILSNDTSCANLLISKIKNAKAVKEAISHAVEQARANKGITMSEVIGDVNPR